MGMVQTLRSAVEVASMKVPPKRKGNRSGAPDHLPDFPCLNESPSEKEGKLKTALCTVWSPISLNESPSEKEGKFLSLIS